MMMFSLGFFIAFTILLLIFVIMFYDFNILKEKEKKNKPNDKKDLNEEVDIDKISFFR